MFTMHLLRRLALVVVVSLISLPASHALEGRFFAVMKESLKVNRCGRERDRLLLTADIFTGGTFTAYVSEPYANGGVRQTLTGTWTANANGRKLALALDTASENTFVESVRQWASDICGLTVTVTEASPVTFTMVLNKQRDRATVRVRYKGRGFTSAGPGRASYSAVVVGGRGVFFDLDAYPLPDAPGP